MIPDLSTVTDFFAPQQPASAAPLYTPPPAQSDPSPVLALIAGGVVLAGVAGVFLYMRNMRKR